MFDSDNPAVLADAMFAGCRVATYADLITPALVQQFAGRLLVIDRGHGDPLGMAHIVDCESGAVTAAQCVQKIKAWNTAGRGHIAVYANRSTMPAVLAACLPVRPYQWVATLDGTMNPDGHYPSAVQFAGEDKLGKHVDISVVYDENWFPMPAPVSAQQLANVRHDAAALVTLAGSLQQGISRL
jgi:hypothetical protein